MILKGYLSRTETSLKQKRKYSKNEEKLEWDILLFPVLKPSKDSDIYQKNNISDIRLNL
jgi:hypothetical protein